MLLQPIDATVAKIATAACLYPIMGVLHQCAWLCSCSSSCSAEGAEKADAVRPYHFFSGFTISAFSIMLNPSRVLSLPRTVIVLAARSASCLFIGLCSPMRRYVLPSWLLMPTGK